MQPIKSWINGRNLFLTVQASGFSRKYSVVNRVEGWLAMLAALEDLLREFRAFAKGVFGVLTEDQGKKSSFIRGISGVFYYIDIFQRIEVISIVDPRFVQGIRWGSFLFSTARRVMSAFRLFEKLDALQEVDNDEKMFYRFSLIASVSKKFFLVVDRAFLASNSLDTKWSRSVQGLIPFFDFIHKSCLSASIDAKKPELENILFL